MNNNYQYWQNPFAYNAQMNNAQMNQIQWNPSQINQNQTVAPANTSQGLTQTTVRTVNGRDGAVSAPMAPNSSELFVDETASLIWYVRTDSAGFKCEVLSYPIANNTSEASDYALDSFQKSIEKRITRLEELANAKSDNANNRSKKSD